LAGIYIHIPFCKQACTYCNFHFSVSLKNKVAFIDALIKEIYTTNDFISNKNISSIYFGGGTPSLLSKDDLRLVFDALQNNFTIEKDVEITLEANPDDVTKVNLEIWQSIGINRLSIGLQSFNDEELIWMNRAHNAKESLLCLDLISASTISNFSVDLIYGSPFLSNEDLIKNFTIIAKRNIPHISCYALTVEGGTLLHKQIKENKSPHINTEKQAEQFQLLLSLMEQHDYEQYEISNFSKKGCRSKHNSSYWQGIPYFGFGPSAHSFNGYDKRRWNVASNGLYIQSIEKSIIPFEEETLTENDRINEYVMTALRTIEGVDLEKVSAEFGKENEARLLLQSEKYLKVNKLIVYQNNIMLTKKGKFFADGIAADLFV
jgi:oxygen-independent coproporphyrinogen III oxidase